jgi:hypothetical protein
MRCHSLMKRSHFADAPLLVMTHESMPLSKAPQPARPMAPDDAGLLLAGQLPALLPITAK